MLPTYIVNKKHTTIEKDIKNLNNINSLSQEIARNFWWYNKLNQLVFLGLLDAFIFSTRVSIDVRYFSSKKNQDHISDESDNIFGERSTHKKKKHKRSHDNIFGERYTHKKNKMNNNNKKNSTGTDTICHIRY